MTPRPHRLQMPLPFGLDEPVRLAAVVPPNPDNGFHRLTGPYVEAFWLPLVGPSTLCLCRFIDIRQGEVWTPMEIAGALGIGREAIERTLHRAEQFKFVATSLDRLAVWAFVPPVPTYQLDRLPVRVRELEGAPL